MPPRRDPNAEPQVRAPRRRYVEPKIPAGKCSDFANDNIRETSVSTCFNKGLKIGYRLGLTRKPPLAELSLRELGKYAKEYKIKNYGKMTKGELTEALTEAGYPRPPKVKEDEIDGEGLSMSKSSKVIPRMDISHSIDMVLLLLSILSDISSNPALASAFTTTEIQALIRLSNSEIPVSELQTLPITPEAYASKYQKAKQSLKASKGSKKKIQPITFSQF